MKSDDSTGLLRSIGELSQLSLAIGTSIDLEENCEQFFNHLMSRKDLSGVSVWVCRERETGTSYQRVYAYPAQQGREWLDQPPIDVLALPLNTLQLLTPETIHPLPSFIDDNGSAVLVFRDAEQVGFVLLHSYLWLSEPLPRAEQGQLHLLLSKLMRSVKGCLVHRELQEEMEAHNESRERERALQYRISRMERLESIAEIVGHTAHDLNNLFSPVLLYPSMVLAQLPDNISPDVVKDIKAIEASAQAAVDILKDLLSISRSGRRITERVHLPEVVDAFSRLASFREMQKRHPNIAFSFDCESEVPPITGVAVQCTQALLNLITNACEEMPAGGRIETSVRQGTYSEAVSGYEEIPSGSYVILEVRDTGPGVPPEILDRIFEPYVSRKEMGRSGSGLGLAVVYGVVKHVDGFVDIQTEPGIGTSFRLHFPVKQEE